MSHAKDRAFAEAAKEFLPDLRQWSRSTGSTAADAMAALTIALEQRGLLFERMPDEEETVKSSCISSLFFSTEGDLATLSGAGREIAEIVVAWFDRGDVQSLRTALAEAALVLASYGLEGPAATARSAVASAAWQPVRLSERQKRCIAKLAKAGHDTSLAEGLLAEMLRSEALLAIRPRRRMT